MEEPENIEKGEDGVVERWLKEFRLADKRDKDWMEDAKEALKIYTGRSYKDDDHTKKKDTFNILWSNVETKRPALYNSSARPDVRRRFRDENPIGKHVSEVLERALSFTIEEGFEEEVIMAVNDMLLPGRAITRVSLHSALSEDGVDFQEIRFDQVQFKDFKHGPAKRWKDVPWIAFKHLMTKDDVRERFPEFEGKLTYADTAHEETENKKDDKDDKSIFGRAEIYEIWDKEEREVIFIAPCYKDVALEVMDDPMGLKDFYPIPRPLYAIENPSTLVPSTEYSMYETLARELESITNRLNKIIDGLRLRGIYDSTLVEMEELFDASDNGFIPATDVSRLIEGRGIGNAIWMLPIKEMAEVLIHLYQRREALVQEVYQITGISDIMRGATNPHETLGAQEIKSNFGTQRLQRQQREVQRYIRDLIRIAAELIAENFSAEMLQIMTGLRYPSMAEKEQAQFMQGEQQDPMMALPSWEEILNVLQSDLLREFAVDVETDSTIQNEQAQDEERVTKLLTGLMNFMDGMAPAVQQGILPMETAKQILKVSLRRFKFGRELEDAIDSMGQQQQENPEDQTAEMEMQAQQVEMQMKQMEMQVKQAETQAKVQQAQMDMQAAQQEMEHKQHEHALKMEELQLKRQIDQEKAQADLLKIRAQGRENASQSQGTTRP